MAAYPWSELIETWFAETLDDPGLIPKRMGWWFSADQERDARLAEQFGDLVEQCASGRLYRWLDHPEGRLAAAHTGQDLELKPIQRAFLYMPLQHFEDLQAQEAGIALYQRLADDNPEWPVYRDGFLPFAGQHRDIIARFGRFPHRNKILNREDTAEEAEYLAGDAPTFGQ